MATRKPAVKGRFYPSGETRLKEMLSITDLASDENIPDTVDDLMIIGGIVPHAGYIYSGKIAASFFKLLRGSQTRINTFVLLHPNHYGRGPHIACDINEAWETPLGTVELDTALSEKLRLETSGEAHQLEHSCEVLLPFLQFYISYPFKILPVAIHSAGLKSCVELAMQLRKIIQDSNQNIMVIASTDFSHFVSALTGASEDELAIHHILNLNASGFYETVRRRKLSICGFEPVTTLLAYASNRVQPAMVKMLARGHSGQNNFAESVVHYASFVIYENSER